MEESILITIKKLLGISREYMHFDTDIITHINTVFLNLQQLGVGPVEGFSIKDEKTKWQDFINDNKKLNAVQTYIYLKVRLVFDPPLNSAVLEANKQMINELEWRLNVEAESK
jgi:hypothetical protein